MLALAWAQIQADSGDLWQLREVQKDVEEEAAALPIEQQAALFAERRVVFERALRLVGSETPSLLFQAAIPVPDFMRLQGIYARLAAAAAADAAARTPGTTECEVLSRAATCDDQAPPGAAPPLPGAACDGAQ